MQKPLAERWAMDIESYKQGAKTQVSSPQCKTCKFRIQSDAFHCEIFVTEEKPDDVAFCQKECPHYQNLTPLKLNEIPAEKQVLFAGIFGFVVADALGVPAEFSSREERDQDPYREMRAYGTYHQGFGTWSDDSSLMLCLLEAMVRGYSLEKVAENLMAYYRHAAFTPWDEVFDIGFGTRRAIGKMIQNFPLDQVGGRSERDNGNGSLITHAHPVSQFACIFYVFLAAELLRSKEKDAATLALVQRHLSAHPLPERYADVWLVYSHILSGDLFERKRSEIRSTGYVVDTLEAVLWLFMRYDSYEKIVFGAINLGGDTDTIAAIAGGLAGIYYGLFAIPERWIQVLPKKEEIADWLMAF